MSDGSIKNNLVTKLWWAILAILLVYPALQQTLLFSAANKLFEPGTLIFRLFLYIVVDYVLFFPIYFVLYGLATKKSITRKFIWVGVCIYFLALLFITVINWIGMSYEIQELSYLNKVLSKSPVVANKSSKDANIDITIPAANWHVIVMVKHIMPIAFFLVFAPVVIFAFCLHLSRSRRVWRKENIVAHNE